MSIEQTSLRPRKKSWARTLRWPLIAGSVATLLGGAGLWLAFVYAEPAPSEIIRYAERRLVGHPKLELFALPVLHAWRAQVERSVSGPLPSLGKGQQVAGLQHQAYRQNG